MYIGKGVSQSKQGNKCENRSSNERTNERSGIQNEGNELIKESPVRPLRCTCCYFFSLYFLRERERERVVLVTIAVTCVCASWLTCPYLFLHEYSTVKAGYKKNRVKNISLQKRILMPLISFNFSHKSTRYMNNARYENRFSADQRYSYIQLWLYVLCSSRGHNKAYQETSHNSLHCLLLNLSKKWMHLSFSIVEIRLLFYFLSLSLSMHLFLACSLSREREQWYLIIPFPFSPSSSARRSIEKETERERKTRCCLLKRCSFRKQAYMRNMHPVRRTQQQNNVIAVSKIERRRRRTLCRPAR